MEHQINKALLGAITSVDKSEADMAAAIEQGSKAANKAWTTIKQVCEIDDSQLCYLKDPTGEDKKNNHWVSTRSMWYHHIGVALLGNSMKYMYDKNVVGTDEITAEGGRQKGKRKTKRTWQQDIGQISNRSIGYIDNVINPEKKKRDGSTSTHIDLLHKGLKSVLTQVNKKKPDGTIKDPVIEKLKGKSTQDLFNLLIK
jgi:hypothetical protein